MPSQVPNLNVCIWQGHCNCNATLVCLPRLVVIEYFPLCFDRSVLTANQWCFCTLKIVVECWWKWKKHKMLQGNPKTTTFYNRTWKSGFFLTVVNVQSYSKIFFFRIIYRFCSKDIHKTTLNGRVQLDLNSLSDSSWINDYWWLFYWFISTIAFCTIL